MTLKIYTGIHNPNFLLVVGKKVKSVQSVYNHRWIAVESGQGLNPLYAPIVFHYLEYAGNQWTVPISVVTCQYTFN